MSAQSVEGRCEPCESPHAPHHATLGSTTRDTVPLSADCYAAYMVELSAATPRPTRFTTLRALWHKYGLIVVGNVVFFALLYFLQYRPNSREARASELLTLAQQQEAELKLEAADVLYSRIVVAYGDCEAADVARQRVPKVTALLTQQRETQPPLPEACAAKVDLRELLALTPSFYLAELVAGHFPDVTAAERDGYYATLDRYVRTALNQDGVSLDKLRASPAFQAGQLRRRYFDIKARASFTQDLVLDDFKLENQSYFALHNAVIEFAVKQGDSTEQGSVRVARLSPKASVDVLEFRVASDGGAVEVRVQIVADEGKANFQQRL